MTYILHAGDFFNGSGYNGVDREPASGHMHSSEVRLINDIA